MELPKQNKENTSGRLEFKPAVSISNAGEAEYAFWKIHDAAHELDPYSEDYRALYLKFYEYLVKRDSLVYDLSVESLEEPCKHYVNAVQHHDYVEIMESNGHAIDWRPAVGQLTEYFDGLQAARGIPEENVNKLVNAELSRWQAHHKKDYLAFAENTHLLYALLFNIDCPLEILSTFVAASTFHDDAEKWGRGEPAWLNTKELLTAHYRLLKKHIRQFRK